MEFHEAAGIFPLDEENIPDLAKDIRANGQHQAIELLDGKIIDGRRRFKACAKAGVKPKFRDVEVSDPVAYVLSLNLHRRHLSASQLAMVGHKAEEMYVKQAKERQKDAAVRGNKNRAAESHVPVVENLPQPDHGKARDKAGAAVGVSGKLIDYAGKVREKGIPELAAAVEEGRMSVSSAAKIADKPEEVQKEYAEQAKFSGGRYRKPEKVESEKNHPNNGKEVIGKGVALANEAINCLTRIPKNDRLRKRGLQIVMDWCRRAMKEC